MRLIEPPADRLNGVDLQPLAQTRFVADQPPNPKSARGRRIDAPPAPAVPDGERHTHEFH